MSAAWGNDVVRRPRPTPMSFMAMAWLLLIDSADGFRHGRFSAGAALTGLTVLVAIHSYLFRYRDRDDREPLLTPAGKTVPWLLPAFLVVVVADGILHGPTVDGAQNVMVYVSFVVTVIVTARSSSEGTADGMLRRMRVIGFVVALVYLATVAKSGLQPSLVYGPRGFALAALILLAATVATRGSRLLPLLLMVAIVLSLSRVATAAALIILFLGIAVRGNKSGRLLRAVAMLGAAAWAGWELVSRYAPLRDRFFGGDQAFDYNGLRFNTSGRTQLWSLVWHDSLRHLWFGDGPGSAEVLVTDHFGGEVGHPHNDYLRLLHDFGIVGAGLFVVGMLILMWRVWRRGRVTGHPIHWAALLALIAVMLTAITDNVLVYPFVMVPLGLLLGASLARTPAEPAEPSDGDGDPVGAVADVGGAAGRRGQ